MAESGISPDELIQFEMALAKELGKRGFEMLLSGDTLNFEDTKTKRRGTADLAPFYKPYKEGKKIEEIADQIVGMAAAAPAAPSPPPQAQAPAQAQQQVPGLDPNTIVPLLKGPDFVAAYFTAVENKFGKGLTRDHFAIPRFFRYAEGHEAYIFCGIDIGGRREYVNNAVLKELKMSDSELYAKMMQNLAGAVDFIIREKKYKVEKRPDGAFTLMFPGGLTPSFLLLAHRQFDWLGEMCGAKDAKFFYAFTVSGDEVVLCGPSATKETLEKIASEAFQKQSELAKGPNFSQIVRVEPLVISREGLAFLNPRQPSPTH